MTQVPLSKELRAISDILDGLRFDSLDQNPKGVRDLLYSTISRAEQLEKQSVELAGKFVNRLMSCANGNGRSENWPDEEEVVQDFWDLFQELKEARKKEK